MEILLWLVPAALATGVAMLAVGWMGRERTDQVPDSRSAPRTEPPTEFLGQPGEAVSEARAAPTLSQSGPAVPAVPPRRSDPPRRTA